MIARNRSRKWWNPLLVVALLAAASSAGADLLDSIQVRSQEGVTEYQIDFSIPVTYVRHFPPEEGQRVQLYLWSARMAGIEPIETTVYKPRRDPERDLPFSVEYTTARRCFGTGDEILGREPICLDIQFKQPMHYRIRPGTDGRSIVLTVLPSIKPVAPNPKK